MAADVKKNSRKRHSSDKVSLGARLTKVRADAEPDWDKLHWHVERGGVTVH